MTGGDFYGNEKSAVIANAGQLRIEHVGTDGKTTVLKDAVKVKDSHQADRGSSADRAPSADRAKGVVSVAGSPTRCWQPSTKTAMVNCLKKKSMVPSVLSSHWTATAIVDWTPRNCVPTWKACRDSSDVVV